MGAQASTTQSGTVAKNPFIAGAPDTPTIAGLVGGAESFGILNIDPSQLVLPAGSLDSAGNPLSLGDSVLDANASGLAVAGLVRYDDFSSIASAPAFGDVDYAGYDLLLFFGTGVVELTNPLLGVRDLEGVVPIGAAESVEHFEPLLTGGYANDPLFGGTMDQTLNSVDALSVYGFLIPEDTGADHNFAFSVQSDDGGTITVASASLNGLGNGQYVFAEASPQKEIINSVWNTNSDGDWNNVSRWTNTRVSDGTVLTGLYPANTLGNAFNVTIDNGSATVSQNVTVVLDRLTIGGSNSLDIEDAQTMVIDMQPIRTDSGVIENNGLITLGAATHVADTTTLRFNGQVMLTGTGTLTSTDFMGNSINGLRRSISLVNDQSHTIAVAGKLGDDRLLFENRGTVRPVGVVPLVIDPTGDQSRNTAAILNSGLIEVTQSGAMGQQLVLQDGFAHNQAGGIISARNAGTLGLHGTRLHNDGIMEVLSNATLMITGTSGLLGNDPDFDTSANLHIMMADFENRVKLGVNGSIMGSIVDNNGATLGNTHVTQGTTITMGDSTIIGGTLAGTVNISNAPGGSVWFENITLETGATLDGTGGIIAMSGRILANGSLNTPSVIVLGDTVLDSNTSSTKSVNLSAQDNYEVTYSAGTTWTAADTSNELTTRNYATLLDGDFDPGGTKDSLTPHFFNHGTLGGQSQILRGRLLRKS